MYSNRTVSGATAANSSNSSTLVVEWFARGASDEAVLRALTGGLPTPVHHPAALVRSRRTAKLPPEPVPRPPLRVLECAKCGTPGRPEALPGGMCGACRGEHAAARPSAPLSPHAVHTRAARIRAAMVQQRREGTPV
ncbi:hypothetical protein ACWGI9_25490 [Streptomyces sp. NPDC054833]